MGSRGLRSGRLLALSFLVGLVLVAPVRAQSEPPDDFDQDGVTDDLDDCDETPLGDLVDAAGCSLCPCDETLDAEPWPSHQSYVECVIAEAKRMRAARQLTRKQKKAAVKRAKRSTCGTEELTRCCVYPDYDVDADSVVGDCRIMTPDECFALGDRVDAEDEGSGSCNPNPCVF
jgi:hypothetical protein